MASSADLTIEQGATFGATISVKNSDLSAFNLSGYTARGQVRNSYGASGVLLNMAPVIQTGVNNAALISGLIDIDLTATATAALPINEARYDIEIFNAGGDVTRVLKGKAIITPEVTR